MIRKETVSQSLRRRQLPKKSNITKLANPHIVFGIVQCFSPSANASVIIFEKVVLVDVVILRSGAM